MYEDCNFFNILKIHLYFTSYKDKFKILKQKITSKTTLICTHTQRIKIKEKNSKFDENNFNLKYIRMYEELLESKC
jgi:capsular polysaccharide biosynthesis protein